MRSKRWKVRRVVGQNDRGRAFGAGFRSRRLPDGEQVVLDQDKEQ
jgi:hypothetical protein